MTMTPDSFQYPFTARLDAVRTAFSPVGGAPTVSGDLTAADDAVVDRLRDLTDQFTGPSAADLEAAGVAYASGKGLTKAKAAMTSPSTDSARFRAIYAAASTELVRRHDDPRFSVATLVAECAEQAGDYLRAIAREAAASLDTLPAPVLARLAAGELRPDTLASLDANTMPLEDIAACREAASTWSAVYALTGGMAASTDAFRDMFRAIATASVTGGRQLDLAEGPAGRWAVWMDAPGCVAMSAGLNVVAVLTAGRGHLEPLVDPFGEDAAEYRRRVDAWNGLTGWLGTLDNVVAPRLREYEPLMSVQAAVRKSHRDYSLVQRTGHSPESAVDAFLALHPEYAGDDTHAA